MELSQGYIGSVCEIKDQDNHVIAVGVIQEINEEKGSIYIGEYKAALERIKHHTKAVVSIFNSKLGRTALEGCLGFYSQGLLAVTGAQNIEEKRSFLRVNVGQCSVISYTDPQGELGEANVEIKNISLGGIGISCEELFEKGQILLIDVSLDGRTTDMLGCSVMWRKSLPEGQFEYGCCFQELEQTEHAKLSMFIFQRQQEEVKLQKNVDLEL